MAAIPPPVVTSIGSIERADDGSVTLTFVGAAEPQSVHLSKNALTELFVILTSFPPADSGAAFDLAPVRALGVSPFGRTDGTAGLVFGLPGGWCIPFAIPAGAIPGVRSAIDQIEQLLAPARGPTQ
jgi:hypothetical protein